MNKYIDAEKLRVEIERKISACEKQRADAIEVECYNLADASSARMGELYVVLETITSLQQEQPEVQNEKFIFPKYLYARTKDNKTIDMSYAPQDMTAVEYVRNDFVEQEQPGNKEKFMNFFDAVGDCGFSQHDILLLKNIWKEAGCPPPKSQVADASKMEQPEVDLDKLVNEEFASHSRITEYGLEVTYNRAELYQLIKRMALVFNARKEE